MNRLPWNIASATSLQWFMARAADVCWLTMLIVVWPAAFPAEFYLWRAVNPLVLIVFIPWHLVPWSGCVLSITAVGLAARYLANDNPPGLMALVISLAVLGACHTTRLPRASHARSRAAADTNV